MTEEELKNAAIQSVLNMGPTKHMFHPDYGWVLRDGKVTQVGEEFFRKAYAEKLVCPNPRQEVIVNCCVCDGFLVNGTCVQEFCLANPNHKKWEVPKKTSILTKVKVFILGLFLTGCSSMPSDSFNQSPQSKLLPQRTVATAGPRIVCQGWQKES